MEEIYRAGGRLDLAITLHDDRAVTKSGRVFIDDFCTQNKIDLVKIRHVNDDQSINAIRDREIDWLFIIGWSQIAGKAVLDAPKRGVLGIHPTLLPVGRGRAPIPWAIIKGLKETGVTLFKLDDGVDTGEIVGQEIIPIADDETAATLYKRVDDAHRTLIGNIWRDLVEDRIKLRKQDESKATVWEGRKPEDGRILPEMSVAEIDRLVRGVTHPYPGAFWEETDRIVRIWAGKIGNCRRDDSESYLIHSSDGIYSATDFEFQLKNIRP
jgi:methionyl-tRNA formyltransferase